MGQVIQVASGGKAESKAFTPADQLMMIGAAGCKGKIIDSQSGTGEEDLNALVPFLQLLNQQMSQTSKSSDATAINIDGKEITQEQAMLLLPVDITLKELQLAPANLAEAGVDTAEIDPGEDGQQGFTFDALLTEVDLLKKDLDEGDLNGEDSLLAVFLEQVGTGEKVLNGENKVDEEISATLDKELNIKSGDKENEQKIINDKNVILDMPAGMPWEEGENKLPSGAGPSATAPTRIAEMDLKNLTVTISDEAKSNNLNFQSQMEAEAVDGEIKFTTPEKEAQNILKTEEKTLPPGKMIFREAQLSESTAGKITVNLAEVKEENKTSQDITSSESGEENNTIRSNSRLSTQDVKESQVNKDNLRFAEAQYSNTVKANAGNKTQPDTMQAILEEVSGSINAEQKVTTIVSEKRNEEVSLTSANAAVSGTVSSEKINAVSTDKIIGQITSEIKEAAANDGGRIKITLNPPSLGKLEMDVTVRNGKVEVILVADNKDVQQILNTHIDKLKGGLQNQGLTIDRCDVFMQDKREGYQQNFNQQTFYHNDRSGRDSNNRQEPPAEEVMAGAIISEQPVNIIRASTDNISLFA